MKWIILLWLTFETSSIHAQNWKGSQNFIDLYMKSDIVVIGKISNIETYKQDSLQAISCISMPLKRLTISNTKAIKGNLQVEKIFYKDIFNGCGNAPILVENILDKETIFLAKIKNDSIFQLESMNESVSEIVTALIAFDQAKEKKTYIVKERE